MQLAVVLEERGPEPLWQQRSMVGVTAVFARPRDGIRVCRGASQVARRERALKLHGIDEHLLHERP